MTIAELRTTYDLTLKQACFVAEYFVDKNATQAYIRVGYSPIAADVKACKMLRVAKVARAVDDWMATLTTESGWTPEKIIEKAAKIVEMSMQATPVEVFDYATKTMTPTGEYVYDSKGAVSALALISKITGAEKQADRNVNVNLTGGLSIALRRKK